MSSDGESDAGAHGIVDVEQHESGTVKRPQRTKNLTLKARENKLALLIVEIARTINSHLTECEASFASLKDSNSVSDLEQLLQHIDKDYEVVNNQYTELQQVSETGIDKTTTELFNSYCDEIKAHKDNIQLGIEQIELEKAEDAEERALDAEMEETRKKLEEQMKLFNERKKRKLELKQSNSNSPTSNATIPIQGDTTSNTTQTLSLSDMSSLTPLPINSTVTPPIAQTDNSVNAVQQLAASLADSVRSSTRRRIAVEPSVFTGIIFDFNDWESDFDVYLKAEEITGIDQLRHLKRFVEGDAKKCIAGFFMINTEEAYIQARRQLKERYGNKQNVSRSFRKRLKEWPKVHTKDGMALQEFGDFLSHCNSAIKTVPELGILNDCEQNEMLVEKLPDWLKNRWARQVAQTERQHFRYPTLAEFTNFIQIEADIMMLPLMQNAQSSSNKTKQNTQTSTQYNSSTTKSRQQPARTFQANVSQEKENSGCRFCHKRNHETSDCFMLEKKPYLDRREFVMEQRLCFACLKPQHLARDCKEKATCSKCNRKHPTSLHDENYKRATAKNQQTQLETPKRYDVDSTTEKTKTEQTKQAEIRVNTSQIQRGRLAMAVPVYVSAGNAEKLVYALLDTQSDTSFITKTVAESITPAKSMEKLTLCTLNGKTTKDTTRYMNIQLRGYLTDNSTHINAYEQDDISCGKQFIPTAQKASAMSHLQCIAKDLPPLLDIPIGLLIGMDCPQALTPLNSIPGGEGETFAMETMFGWTLCGGAPSKESSHHSYKVNVQKDTEIQKLLERDFRETSDEHMSQDDLKFLNMLDKETTKDEKGSYILPLPFKETACMPDNKLQAERRLEQLLRRLKSDPQYKAEYFKFMDDLVDQGHAEEIKDLPENEASGQQWYIPHFGVRHPKKKKLRVVFDASAKFKGRSLNDVLLQGPDQMNNMLGILCRFRQEPIAICCDIEKMFYNFKVKAEHKDYLRFLWVDSKMNEIKTYRMTVHLFGATSSPAVATYGLRRLAEDECHSKPRACSFLKESFYVDDGIASVSTIEDAIHLIQEAREVCQRGNIRLHKFVSNDKNVLKSIPASERSEKIINLDLVHDQLPKERTLGLEWNVHSDRFEFRNQFISKPTTKRGILSAVAQIYDPLGFLAPFILNGKMVLQKVVAMQQDWDAPISSEIEAEWKAWMRQLSDLSSIQIPRCVKSPSLSKVAKREMHYFSDASLKGYGSCAYLKLIDDQDQVSCSLMLSKARVNPIKPVTVPRLELQAAVISTQLCKVLRRELKLKIDQEFFGTDSRIVLGYISNQSKKFHMYVANRVQQIKDATVSEQWNYVSTDDNPADIASRGSSLSALPDSAWYHGPDFLQNSDISEYIDKHEKPSKVDDGDPEVKSVKSFATTTKVENLSLKFDRFSSWKSLGKSLAILQCIVKNKSWKHPQLQSDDIRKAEALVLKTVQTRSYADDIEKLRQNKVIGIQSSLKKLNPFLDQHGLLRVGGRLRNADMSDWEKHPILIPKNTHVARLIVQHFHQQVHHTGRRTTLAAIRQAGYWIISGSTMVKSVLNQCVVCAKLRGPVSTQLMADLPEERVHKTPPFTQVGMDVFGPFTVKDRRTLLKRYGLLFTCMYSRSVHIEMLDDLSTDSFMNSLRCLIAIRGPVKTLVSDRGTNFVGAKNLLDHELSTVSDPKLKTYLLDNQIKFKMNTPDASHTGGAWERVIRSARAVLNGMIPKYHEQLNSQTLRTAFHEVACVLNNKPLTGSNIGDPNEKIITPNQLLTMKDSNPTPPPPPGAFNDEIYGNSRWKRAQELAEEFYKVWKSEYLTQLTKRQKWLQKEVNIKVGAVVVLKDESTTRGLWRLAVVDDIHKSDDGLVRTVTLRLSNSNLTAKGIPVSPATIIKRPVQKIVPIFTK